jgi:tRNA-specific 2-thiouridylase
MLDIPYYVMNFKKEFKENVMDYFVGEYLCGRTPNPCIACNRFVKWETLLQRSLSLGADYIATGHYARIEQLPNGRYSLKTSVTAAKDQTYALYNLTQEQLKSTIMPLGDYTKEEIREIVEKNNLVNAKKRDSQEICFIPDNDYAGFIEKNYGYKAKKGKFVDVNGNVLGEHRGIINYTIGQRKGLEIAFGQRMYVVGIDVEKNQVILGNDEDLFRDTLICDRLNWMMIDGLTHPIQVTAKIRYAAKPETATLYPIEDGKVKVVFEAKQRAITAGQSVVFYDGDKVVGGGTIC